MTRVYVSGEGFVLRVPECWVSWVYGGVRYRRRCGLVEQQIGKRWEPVSAVTVD